MAIDVTNRFAAPGWSHWAGTDQLGRDALSRLTWGTRNALGMIAGYGPRWLDALLILIVDALSSLPKVMFALVVITGPSTGTGTGTAWIQVSSATFDLKAARSSAMASSGVFQSRVVRGRGFIRRATSFRVI